MACEVFCQGNVNLQGIMLGVWAWLRGCLANRGLFGGLLSKYIKRDWTSAPTARQKYSNIVCGCILNGEHTANNEVTAADLFLTDKGWGVLYLAFRDWAGRARHIGW
jgi:hypothetical protein